MLDRTVGYNPETEALLDLSTPSLQALSHVLRNRYLWPEGFEWNFANCHQCAMGMAYKLWMDIEEPYTRSMYPLGVNRNEAYRLFVFPPPPYDHRITPEYIADLIDKHLDAKTG